MLCLAFITWRVSSTLERVESFVERSQVTTTAFNVNGGQVAVTTERIEGESVDAWIDRHKEALRGIAR